MGWDMELDYSKTYKLLTRELEAARKKNGIKALKRRLYLILLLTQLRNGSRIGETIEFIHQISQEFSREGTVRVEKRKDEYYRTMILPKEITKYDILAVKGLLDEEFSKGKKNLVMKTSTWAKKALGINTHSLRYAFITYLTDKGYPPQLISKITGHRRLDYIVHYTQERAAKAVLMNLDTL